MDIAKLKQTWGQNPERCQLTVRVSVHTKDRLERLLAQYPNLTMNKLAEDLLVMALDEVDKS